MRRLGGGPPPTGVLPLGPILLCGLDCAGKSRSFWSLTARNGSTQSLDTVPISNRSRMGTRTSSAPEMWNTYSATSLPTIPPCISSDSCRRWAKITRRAAFATWMVTPSESPSSARRQLPGEPSPSLPTRKGSPRKDWRPSRAFAPSPNTSGPALHQLERSRGS